MKPSIIEECTICRINPCIYLHFACKECWECMKCEIANYKETTDSEESGCSTVSEEKVVVKKVIFEIKNLNDEFSDSDFLNK